MFVHRRMSVLFMAFASLLLLSGCAETEFLSHYAKKMHLPGQEEGAGMYKVGKPYQVGSVWYYPQEDFGLTESGIASWYGPDFHGKRTANGEIYDQNELTAAHRTLQMPSFVRVTNLENGRSIVVRINDRGPFKHGRIIDLSKRAADLLGFRSKGTARVRLEVLEQESRRAASIAKSGADISRLTLADVNKVDQPMEPIVQQASYEAPPVRMAQLQNDAEALPESLQTPTITVEELSAPGKSRYQPPAPVWNGEPSVEQRPVPQPRSVPSGTKIGGYSAPLTGSHTDRAGHELPDPVVSSVPVSPTGIFVQAGSFAVYENAERLSVKLSKIASTKIEPVTVKGRQLYRVKLGPIATVEQADAVLEKVIRAGNDTAKVVKQ